MNDPVLRQHADGSSVFLDGWCWMGVDGCRPALNPASGVFRYSDSALSHDRSGPMNLTLCQKAGLFHLIEE